MIANGPRMHICFIKMAEVASSLETIRALPALPGYILMVFLRRATMYSEFSNSPHSYDRVSFRRLRCVKRDHGIQLAEPFPSVVLDNLSYRKDVSLVLRVGSPLPHHINTT